MRQPLTLHEVLGYWLISQVGEPKRVKPKGYSKSAKTQKATMATVCLLAVSQVEGYDEVKSDLKEWVSVNGVGLEGMIAVHDFLNRVQSVLQISPIYLISATEDEAVKPVEPLTVSQFAQASKVPVATVRWWCDNGIIEAYKYGKKWMIPEREIVKVKELRTA